MVEPDDFVYCEHGEDPALCPVCLSRESLPMVDVELMLQRHHAMLREPEPVTEDVIGHPLS